VVRLHWLEKDLVLFLGWTGILVQKNSKPCRLLPVRSLRLLVRWWWRCRFRWRRLCSLPSTLLNGCVVYGLWGIFVLIPAVRSFQVWFVGATGLNWTPTGIGLLSAILVLSVMVIPYICSIARDVIQLVPNDQREAAYALGATKWEVIRYGILPYARAGILGGVILGLGRAIGETLAVTMVIGNAGEIAKNLFSSTATMSSLIASQFGEAGGTQLSALIAVGFLLLVFSVLVNLVARVVITKLTPVGTRL
jgi:phosphate transport system permease protein